MGLIKSLLPAALLAASVMSVVGSPPVVQIRQGAVKGYIDRATDGRKFFAFKGIPYARPPVGELRFKDPSPALNWSGTLDGSNEAPRCPQYLFMDNIKWNFKQLHGKEDCLFLNVFTPTTAKKWLPVMVWFHGGAWTFGGAPVYPPYSLLVEDVVLVVVQFRLSTLGFLSTEDDAAPGNLGLKDQGLALAWVQQNIDNFGGDPARVTIFGESAGAASVHFHLLSDASKGLFQRAILQSGALTCPWALTDNARSSAYKIGQHLGCADDSDTITSEQLIKCLQEKPLDQIASTYSIFFEFGLFPLAMAPIIDGKFLTAHPSVLMKEGRQQKVDIMAGVTKDEGSFVSSMIYSNGRMFEELSNNFDVMGPLSLGLNADTSLVPLAQAEAAYERYLGAGWRLAQQADQLTQMMSDRQFLVCLHNTVLEHLKTIAGSNKQVYLYELHHKGQQGFADMYEFLFMEDPDVTKKWVSHADDLAYLFPGSVLFAAHEDQVDRNFTRNMVKMWTNFAAFGNPTPDDRLGFIWEGAENGQLRHLVLQSSPFMRDDQRQTSRKFWNSLPLRENLLAHPENFPNIVKRTIEAGKEEL